MHLYSEGILIDGCRRKLSTVLHLPSMYTGWPKKWHSFLYALTLSNINWFSKLFHSQNQEKICNNTITTDSTTPQVCRYITLFWPNVTPPLKRNKLMHLVNKFDLVNGMVWAFYVIKHWGTVLYINCDKMYLAVVCARTRKGSLRCSPDSVAGYRGLILREGKGGRVRKRKGENGGKGQGRKGKGRRGVLSVPDSKSFRCPWFVVSSWSWNIALTWLQIAFWRWEMAMGVDERKIIAVNLVRKKNCCHLTCSTCSWHFMWNASRVLI